VGVQFHPELKSQPLLPHPLFKAFVGAALDRKQAHHRRTQDPRRRGLTV
jgi:CTP synthase